MCALSLTNQPWGQVAGDQACFCQRYYSRFIAHGMIRGLSVLLPAPRPLCAEGAAGRFRSWMWIASGAEAVTAKAAGTAMMLPRCAQQGTSKISSQPRTSPLSTNAASPPPRAIFRDVPPNAGSVAVRGRPGRGGNGVPRRGPPHLRAVPRGGLRELLRHDALDGQLAATGRRRGPRAGLLQVHPEHQAEEAWQ